MAGMSRRREVARGDAKMTAEEYHDLIGQHAHIEHKALREEVAEEFAQITQHTSTQHVAAKALLNPPQPPPIPLETNLAKNQCFRASAAWPKLSVIQRAAHLFHNTIREQEDVIRYLQSVGVPQIQIDIALEVAQWMEQSERYWKKVERVNETRGTSYQSRYNLRTRKYALTKVPWSLQLAMTLMDFHLDHVVDIVYRKTFWARDYVESVDSHPFSPLKSDGTGTSTRDDSYWDETTTTSENQAENVQAPPAFNQESLDDIFAKMTVDIGGKVAFAKDFEVDMEESPGSFDVEEEKDWDERDERLVDELDKLFPRLNRALIVQKYIENGRNEADTKCTLDIMDAQSFVSGGSDGKSQWMIE